MSFYRPTASHAEARGSMTESFFPHQIHSSRIKDTRCQSRHTSNIIICIDELTSAVARGVFSGAPRYTTLEQLIVMIS